MPLTRLAPAAVALALAAGCAQEGGPNRTALGAGIGAAVGAGAGVLAGDSREAALIGAGVGAIAGAGVGAYLDRQAEALRRDLAGTGATVTQAQERLVVTLPQDVTFAFDSADIAPDFRPELAQLAATLQQYPESLIDVIGHTDDTGEPAYNQRLSERRAQSVQSALLADGVRPARVAAYGLGETAPVADNATPEGRARNRRVEIVVTPITRGA
jgi:outer membrane protein OmpA-like peptidoglycan-associated protein